MKLGLIQSRVRIGSVDEKFYRPCEVTFWLVILQKLNKSSDGLGNSILTH